MEGVFVNNKKCVKYCLKQSCYNNFLIKYDVILFVLRDTNLKICGCNEYTQSLTSCI